MELGRLERGRRVAPRVSLVGLSGSGKSSLALALQALLARSNMSAVVVKLADPLYEIQAHYHQLVGLDRASGAQDQELLVSIAANLRRLSATCILSRFLSAVADVGPDVAIINDDLRDSEIDAPGLRSAGFTLVRVRCDEKMRLQRIARRADFSSVDERRLFGRSLESIQCDGEVDTSNLTIEGAACKVVQILAERF